MMINDQLSTIINNDQCCQWSQVVVKAKVYWIATILPYDGLNKVVLPSPKKHEHTLLRLRDVHLVHSLCHTPNFLHNSYDKGQRYRYSDSWWMKYCTSWSVVLSLDFRVWYFPGGAGFRPSTVSKDHDFCCHHHQKNDTTILRP